AAFTSAWAQQPAAFAPRPAPPQGQPGPVTGKPFSATEVRRTTQTLADGSHVEQSETAAFARDAQGRMRSANGAKAMIYDPAAGVIYNLDLATSTYSTTQVAGTPFTVWIAVNGTRTSSGYSTTTGDSAKFAREAGPGAPLEEMLPAQNIAGQYARGTRITTIIPPNAIGNDRELRTIDEKCISDDLQALVKSSRTDPRYGTTT